MITKIRELKLCAVIDFGKKIAQHIEYDFCGMKNKSIMAARILHLSIQWMGTGDGKLEMELMSS
jgi:hypothetical protein